MVRFAVMAVLLCAAADAVLAGEPLLGVDQVAPGFHHSCALADAKVVCWGANDAGQLGNGTRTGTTLAVEVVGLPGPATAIAVGGEQSCAVVAGAAYCWGRSLQSQLAGGASTRAFPAKVVGLESGVAAIAAGERHSCALTSGGAVKCWGAESQLGIGSSNLVNAPLPVEVVGLGSGVASLSAGAEHTCVRTLGGAAKCWGTGFFGQLGNGATQNALVPVEVTGLGSGTASIAAGYRHTCAVTAAGAALCWGSNTSSQLGDGTTTSTSAPVPVAGLGSGVAAITAGEDHTCALTQGGGAKCWGGNGFGQLGDGAFATVNPVPTDVIGMTSGSIALAAGTVLTCAISTPDGALRCWGSNQGGSVGNGTAAFSPRAITTASSQPAVAVGAGGGVACGNNPLVPLSESCYAEAIGHSCALDPAGGVWCWGNNSEGQLGNGTTLRSLVPVPVPSLVGGVQAISLGAAHTCALISTGAVKCWGRNAFGQLGDGSVEMRTAPVEVVGMASGVTAISAGPEHTCALTTAGGAKCWGANQSGQLGNNSLAQASTPQAVTGLESGVLRIAAGGTVASSQLFGGFTCAVTLAGAAKCWGNNDRAQLGSNVSSPAPIPSDVMGLSSGVIAISAGGAHACALLLGGTVHCWGSNLNGQVGMSPFATALLPTVLPWINPGVVALDAGGTHTCVVTAAGDTRCWGNNSWGQLGRSSPAATETIAPVNGQPVPTSAIATGAAHSCAIGPDQRVRCWGVNDSGQLGDGGASAYASPQANMRSRACASFDDVLAASAFCSNVVWLLNRAVTQGCAEASYCPDAATSRLAMAAFLNRTATSLGPGGVSNQGELGPITVYYPTHGVCGALLPPAGDQAQTLHLDGVVSVFGAASASLGVAFYATLPSFSVGLTVPVPVGSAAGRWVQTRILASYPRPHGAQSVSVEFVNDDYVNPVVVDASTCSLRVRIKNREEPLPGPVTP